MMSTYILMTMKHLVYCGWQCGTTLCYINVDRSYVVHYTNSPFIRRLCVVFVIESCFFVYSYDFQNQAQRDGRCWNYLHISPCNMIVILSDIEANLSIYRAKIFSQLMLHYCPQMSNFHTISCVLRCFRPRNLLFCLLGVWHALFQRGLSQVSF